MSNMRNTSLTRQLIAGVLVAEVLCAVLFSAVAVLHEVHGRRRAFDIMLRGRADSLLGAVQDAEDPEDNVAVDPTELKVPDEDVYEVLSPSGRVLGHSPNSLAPLLNVLGLSRKEGYFSFRIAGHHYRGVRFGGVRVIDRDDKGGLRRPVTVIYASPTDDLWQSTVEAVRFYVLASIVLLGLTAVVLIWLLRRRLSPLQELADIAGRVTEHSWDFAPPETVLTTKELAPIAESMNKILEGLHQAFDRQRRLTADAAHEWKTSIAVLKSSLQLLSMRPRTTDQYHAGLQEMVIDVERMEELATRMLALARLEERPYTGTETANLDKAARAIAARLNPIAQIREVDLKIHADSDVQVPLSEAEAETLVSNLVLNAIQHCAQGGTVEVCVTSDSAGPALKVADNGEGIPEAALPHIFERFYRADSSRSRASGGAGLGLAICKAIVDQSSGEIRIHSAPGRGTEAKVQFPAITPADLQPKLKKQQTCERPPSALA